LRRAKRCVKFLEKTMSNLDRAIRDALSKEDAEFLARFEDKGPID